MCQLDLRTAYFVSDRNGVGMIFIICKPMKIWGQQGDPHSRDERGSAILGGALLLNGATEAVTRNYFTKTICGRFANDSLFLISIRTN
ncbi:MAG: hypothetical protein ACLU4N_22260 [Butyricimonas faecihominis]